jgi:hypothetical protein
METLLWMLILIDFDGAGSVAGIHLWSVPSLSLPFIFSTGFRI